MQFDFVKCSARLRSLRDARKESHDTLARCLGEDTASGKSAISKQTLINYEQAARNGGIATGTKTDKTKAICGMSIETLVALAKHFEVSADYLLGLSDRKSVDPNVVTAAKTTGLDENAIRRLILEALTGKKSPILQAVDLLLTTQSGIVFLQDLYRYAIARYDKFTCTIDGKKVEIDSVSINDDSLDIKKMGYAFMSQVQDDLFRLKDEYESNREGATNG